MSTAYGLMAVNDSGAAITSPDTLAMLFAGAVTCAITSGTQVFDFPAVPAGALFALQMTGGSMRGSGTHTWAISDGGGFARLTFTYAKATYQAAQSTTLYLFATNTFEPAYGINALNDSGERVVSTVFPASKFVGKLTLGTTKHAYDTTPIDQATYVLWSTTAAPAAGILFWSLPSSTDTTIWWAGDTKVAAGGTAKMTVKLPTGVVPGTLPEAFIFQTGPMTVSTTWGVRVFDGAGQVMFDGATESLNIVSRVTGVTYAVGGLSYSLPSGFTPGLFMPGYMRDFKSGACVGGFATRKGQAGMMRRNGTTLFSDQINTVSESAGWNCSDAATQYQWGLQTGLFVPVINAQRYGGAAI